MFILRSDYGTAGDQEQAIDSLVEQIQSNQERCVLMGVTGSGKTFAMANIIQRLGVPTLILSHNKTLARQLWQEMSELFPENAVEYFVSYYDYYQLKRISPDATCISTRVTDEREDRTGKILQWHPSSLGRM